ncbi:MAG TPA: RbsD/FucU domain-containing protein [Eubacteriales bacterium]|nr:RbsD/FucU domain-containing protein [Eubacteriales bacterium]
MLLNVPKLLSPELLKAICEMGHGDKILLADGNYPGKSAAARCGAQFVRADGLGVPALMEAILTLMPLDLYTDLPAMVMDVDKRDKGMKIPIHDEYKAIVAKHDDRGADAVGHLERYAFYEKADECCVIVQTGEEAVYANIILQKGVIK